MADFAAVLGNARDYQHHRQRPSARSQPADQLHRQVPELNFANDTDMEQQLEQVRTRFLQRGTGEYRDSSAAQGGLVQGLENSRDRANQMASEDTTAIVEQFGQMGRRRFDLVA